MKKGYLVALIALSALTLLSLTLNGLVIGGLLQARRIALTAVADTRPIVTGLQDDTFSYTLAVSREIPIATSLPVSEEITVPISTTIPINTAVVVPINLGAASYNLQVPIRAVIPVDLDVVVPISQTVDIATTVPLNVDLPIEIPIRDTPLVSFLEKLDAALARIEKRLERPFGSGD